MALRILHTADWHLGKRLYQRELTEDHIQFLAWLKTTIQSEGITHLLISGDVFDLANPSAGAMHLYYQFLKTILAEKCSLIITGGNHDSPSVLNAPSELLQLLDIHVIGGATEDPSQLLIPLKGTNGEVEAVVAAVPYLRDRDVRVTQLGETYHDRIRATQKGIAHYYAQIGQLVQTHYPNIPAIAMGHLYVQGALTSESEREIQVGNLAGVGADIFPSHFQYVALGHIHKPQNITPDLRVCYSGAPIPLSFSEAGQAKRCMLITNSNQTLQVTELPIPTFRNLYRWRGTLTELQTLPSLLASEPNVPFVEAVLEIEVYDTAILRAKDEWLESIRAQGAIEIIDLKVQLIGAEADALEQETTHQQQHVSDIAPEQVFNELLDDRYAPEDKEQLLLAFKELVTEVLHTGTDEN